MSDFPPEEAGPEVRMSSWECLQPLPWCFRERTRLSGRCHRRWLTSTGRVHDPRVSGATVIVGRMQIGLPGPGEESEPTETVWGPAACLWDEARLPRGGRSHRLPVLEAEWPAWRLLWLFTF